MIQLGISGTAKPIAQRLVERPFRSSYENKGRVSHISQRYDAAYHKTESLRSRPPNWSPLPRSKLVERRRGYESCPNPLSLPLAPGSNHVQLLERIT
jgi:hypothetical protein